MFPHTFLFPNALAPLFPCALWYLLHHVLFLNIIPTIDLEAGSRNGAMPCLGLIIIIISKLVFYRIKNAKIVFYIR